MRHDLKCWPEYMDAIIDGRKRFEVRETKDRAFSVGDCLLLYEYDPRQEPGFRLGKRTAEMTVVYLLSGPLVPHGICIMGIEPVREVRHADA